MSRFRTYQERRDAVEALQAQWSINDYTLVAAIAAELHATDFSVTADSVAFSGLYPGMGLGADLTLKRGEYLIKQGSASSGLERGGPMYSVMTCRDFSEKYDVRHPINENSVP